MSTITLAEIKDLARRGKLRFRAFGDDVFFGVGHPYHGDLERAAAALDHVLLSGMIAAYIDEHGIFLGPANPKFVAHGLSGDAPTAKHRGTLQ